MKCSLYIYVIEINSYAKYAVVFIYRIGVSMLQTLQTNDYKIDDYVTYNDSLVYLDFIKNNFTFKEKPVTPAQAYAYQGNLIGLFRELEVEPSLYLFTMYINNINNPVLFKGNITSLKVAIRPPIPSI